MTGLMASKWQRLLTTGFFTLIHSPGVDVGCSADEAVCDGHVAAVAGPQQRGPLAAVQGLDLGPIFLRPLELEFIGRHLD